MQKDYKILIYFSKIVTHKNLNAINDETVIFHSKLFFNRVIEKLPLENVKLGQGCLSWTYATKDSQKLFFIF